MRAVEVKDLKTGKVTQHKTITLAAKYIGELLGKKTKPASVVNSIGRTFFNRFECSYLKDSESSKKKHIVREECDQEIKKDGWNFWQGGITPTVICASRVLPFYNETIFEKLQDILKDFGCVVYFDTSDDEKQAKVRKKCRIEIYRKLENLTFKEKVENMLKMMKKIKV